jgi:chromosome segregation ATPase
MAEDNNGNSAVKQILDAITQVNITLARMEARIENLIQDTKDHEGRLRVLEHDAGDIRVLKAEVDEHIKSAIGKLADKVEVLEGNKDNIKGAMKAVAIITPIISGILSIVGAILVKALAN